MTDTTCDIDGCGVSAAPFGWMPPRFAWALLGSGISAHFIFGLPVIARFPLIGVGVAAIGLWMAIGSKKRFQSLGLALPPQSRPTLLLTDGWFAWSRNPMYIGFSAFLLGVGLIVGSVPALLTGLVFVLIVRRWFVPVEEEQLAQLGPQWVSYARRVPRWL